LPPQNRLCVAHILAAFLAAAAGTERRDASNRSIGRSECIETTGDASDEAAGFVACNRIIVADALCV
jgi:hypothetical protein